MFPNLGATLAANALHGVELPPAVEVLSQARRDGAVLCRGTGIRTAGDLNHFVAPLLADDKMPYFGGTNARQALYGDGDILDVGTEPPHIRLREHSEMAYVDQFPGIIIFGCLQPPERAGEQGQTSLLVTAELMAQLPEAFVARLAAEGLRHKLRYSDAEAPEGTPATVKSWQDTLSVTTRTDAEAACTARGWETEWSADGTLTISYVRPAFARHPHSGAEVLFVTDLSTAWYDDWEPHCNLPDSERPYSFGWGKGDDWSASDGKLWAAAADACRYKHAWAAGDVLIVDNMLAMHGREPYKGERRLGVVLGLPTSREQ